ncbi:MAG: hypothetical protein ACTSR5_07680 [Promethearchaeota archaeon]
MNEDNNNKIKGDFNHQNNISSFEHIKSTQRINKNGTLSIKELVRLWKFTQSEIETLQGLIKLGESATCLKISNFCRKHESTVNTALKNLKDKDIVKKKESSHIWEFIGKEEFQEILIHRMLILIKVLYDNI